MDPVRFRRLRELFEEAVHLPRAERDAFVERALGEDHALGRRLEAMLAEDARDPSGIVDRPLVETGGALPTPGTRLGPYRLLELLGSGGMGAVYLAEIERPGADPPLDRTSHVAVKVLHPHLVGNPTTRERFLREAESGRRVDHPNVVRTYDASTARVGGQKLFYLVVEYVEGRTLRELLTEMGTVPEGLLREIALQVARGLCAIHEAGLVHRDLKPENLLISQRRRIRVMDLGISRRLEDSLAVTWEGLFVGSYLYAAPEQLGEGSTGPPADLYALGVTLYELAVGTNPFRREDLRAVIRAQLEDDPRPVHERNPEVSTFFSALLGSLLAKDPAQRVPSAAKLVEILEHGERSAWWAARERSLLADARRSPRIPVHRDTALYGREQELAALRSAWRKAVAGKGGVVWLLGEAGIGKTRLVDALLRDLNESATVLYGSYAPSGGVGGLSEAIRGRFPASDLDAGLGRYLKATPSLVPALAALLRHEPPPRGTLALEGDALHSAFVHLMRGLAEEAPLLFVVEDLHFANLDSRRVVLSLARALRNLPVLLVLTARPGLPEQEMAHFTGLEHLRRLTLGRLSPREVIRLLRDAFRSERLAEKLGGKIAYKSDGVPFFVFEMIRGLKQGQFIEELPDGSWIESKVVDEIVVPSAVRDLIETRLSDLADADRTLLDLAAVHGYEFDPDLVARVRREPRVHVLERLVVIERRSGIVRNQPFSCRFDHHQIQEIVYGDLAPRLRAEYHTLLARARAERDDAGRGEAAAFLAHHHLCGTTPEEALPHLDAALAHLELGYRNEEAVGLVDRALAIDGLVGGPERRALLLRKADRLSALGTYAEARDAVEEVIRAAEELSDPGLLTEACRRLGSILYSQSSFDEAQAAYARALSAAREKGDRGAEAAAVSAIGNVSWHLGRRDEARRLAEEALRIAREIGNRCVEGHARTGLGMVDLETGRLDDAEEAFRAALDIFEDVGERVDAVNLVGALGDVWRAQGRLQEAQSQYEEQLALAREVGTRYGESFAEANLGKVAIRLGQHDAARAHIERLAALAAELGNRVSEGAAACDLGELEFTLCRVEEAREHFERGLAIAEATGQRSLEAIATGSLGYVAEFAGDYAAALAHHERAGEIFREMGDPVNAATATVMVGRLHTLLGDLDGARTRIEAGLETMRETGSQLNEALARKALAVLAEVAGDAARAEATHEETLARFRELPYPLGIAQSLVARGRLRAVRGRLREGLRDLDEAVALAAEHDLVELDLLAKCWLGLFREEAVGQAEAALRDSARRATKHSQLEAHHVLWKATGSESHLADARRILLELREGAPAAYRESMLAGVPLHREIVEAWASLDLAPVEGGRGEDGEGERRR